MTTSNIKRNEYTLIQQTIVDNSFKPKLQRLEMKQTRNQVGYSFIPTKVEAQTAQATEKSTNFSTVE